MSTEQQEITAPAAPAGQADVARLAARRWRPTDSELLWSLLAIVASLSFLAPLLAATHADIATGYRTLFDASFGSTYGVSSLLLTSVPLILVGLGVALPYRVGLFNVGGEGQLLLGAFVAVFLGVKLGSLDGVPFVWLLPLLCAAAAGALLAAAAAALKAYRGINEIVTTIMLNFIALYLVQYLVAGPFKQNGLQYAASPAVAEGFQLPFIGGQTGVPAGFVIAIVLTLAVFAGTGYTRRGWRQRLVGLAPLAAERQLISVRREQFLALAAGGALAGLGGAAEALGNQFRVGLEFSPGWGFDAVAIALLARGNMLAVLPFAMFFGALHNGSSVLQADLGVPGSLVLVLAGAPVILVAGVLGYRNYRRAIGSRVDAVEDAA